MSTKTPLISVIVVDYKKTNPYLTECLDAITKQSYQNYEIIVVHDYKIPLKYPKLRFKSFGKYVGPAEKRDFGAKMAKGEILAFIDDDAYPHPHWLKNIANHFQNTNIAGVGGPGVTPPSVSWQEAASGWASASPVGAGPYTYRFLPEKKRFVDDYPSMNLSVRKSDFLAVGGFDSDYWPGEDTKLCLDLTYKLGKKIIYDPKALVYHHRRPVWQAHLRQNGNFGIHRGFFARILPQTSFQLVYFGPSIMVIGLFYLLFLSPLRQPPFVYLHGLGWSLLLFYFLSIFLNSIWIGVKSKNIFQATTSLPVIFITHIWYGIRFIQGFLFTNKLDR